MPVFAAVSAPAPSLADLSLEELMNVTVTSVSKREQKLNDAASAISVLSNEDIRRSGATSVPEALRLVPGLQVAAIDSNNWAISARGFNQQFANKLLVMIDGRTVYSPLFSGIYWDAQQVFLEDVERIEVIRGPGATLWGANAVNGVINILTKSARDTQGGLIYGGGGNVHSTLAGARFGGKTGEGTYCRVYGAFQSNDDSRQLNGQPANDRWDVTSGGFRLDHYTKNDGHLTWQGDGYAGNIVGRTWRMSGLNTLGRWTQPLAERSSLEVQAYFDQTRRNDTVDNIVDTADLTFQHMIGLGERHDLIWGAGYRLSESRIKKPSSPATTLLADHVRLGLYSAFIQDEFRITPDRLTFTLGTKIEHNDYTGIEVQPGARLVFNPTPNQSVWAAASRAVRTPSEVEGTDSVATVLGPPQIGPGGGLYLPTYFGNTELKAEILQAYETGYRIRPNPRVSVDLAMFYNDYSSLVTSQFSGFIGGVPGVLVLKPQNVLHGESYGGEALLTVSVSDAWRLSASYSLLKLQMRGGSSLEAEGLESNAPTHQILFRSSHDLNRHTSLDAQIRYVDNVQAIAGYITADLHFTWHPAAYLELSFVGQNLFDASHPEQGGNALGQPTREIPRSFYAKATWRF